MKAKCNDCGHVTLYPYPPGSEYGAPCNICSHCYSPNLHHTGDDRDERRYADSANLHTEWEMARRAARRLTAARWHE